MRIGDKTIAELVDEDKTKEHKLALTAYYEQPMTNAAGSGRKSYRKRKEGAKTRRVQVNIPEDVLVDVELFRDQLNLSEIATDAFRAAVNKIQGHKLTCGECIATQRRLKSGIEKIAAHLRTPILPDEIH